MDIMAIFVVKLLYYFELIQMMENKNGIVLNPKYTMKPEKGWVLLLNSDAADFSININRVIHPIHAMIFCFADGSALPTVIRNAAAYLEIGENIIEYFLERLIENEQEIHTVIEDVKIYFPPHTLVRSSASPYISYSPDDFLYDNLNLNYRRHSSPTTITLMVNNICRTNCFYCYADKRTPVSMRLTLDRIKEIIREAKENHAIHFEIIGGEVVLYKQWKELLTELNRWGYSPMLSTKVPLKEEDITFLKTVRLKHLQFSLDTLIESNLKRILKVDDWYIAQLKHAFKLLSIYKIRFNVHTILTKYNDSVADMQSIYNYLSRFDQVEYWKCDLVGPSLYNQMNFREMEAERNKLLEIKTYLEKQAAQASFPIYSFNLPEEEKIESEEDKKGKMNKFMNRGYCSGNFSNLFILPDGKVTLCEELYWHPAFILGDLNTQSLMDVWNSPKAKNLYHLKQSQIPQDSKCCSCKVFDYCRSSKQVCYKLIVKKYGTDKWYYPDPGCPLG